MSKPGRKEYHVPLRPGDTSPRDMAAALIRHEFPDVASPFGPHDELPAEEVLKRHGIVNLTYALFRQEAESAR